MPLPATFDQLDPDPMDLPFSAQRARRERYAVRECRLFRQALRFALTSAGHGAKDARAQARDTLLRWGYFLRMGMLRHD